MDRRMRPTWRPGTGKIGPPPFRRAGLRRLRLDPGTKVSVLAALRARRSLRSISFSVKNRCGDCLAFGERYSRSPLASELRKNSIKSRGICGDSFKTLQIGADGLQ